MAPKRHPVPEWRRGAFYWRPLLDGREITIYPLLFGAARLCVGPLAEPTGYDNAYRYDSHEKAIRYADLWDPEKSPMPEGFTVIETKKDDDEDAPSVGSYTKVLGDDNYRILKKEDGPNMVTVNRLAKRGRIMFEGVEHRDVNNELVVEVSAVSFERYDGAPGEPQGQSVIVHLDEETEIDGMKFKVLSQEGKERLERHKQNPRTVWPHPGNNDVA